MSNGPDQVGVLSGQADRKTAVDVYRRDDLTVDLSDEDHPRDLEGLGVRYAQSADEFGMLPEALHELAYLRPPAVHDNREDAHRPQKHYVFCERRQGI